MAKSAISRNGRGQQSLLGELGLASISLICALGAASVQAQDAPPAAPTAAPAPAASQPVPSESPLVQGPSPASAPPPAVPPPLPAYRPVEPPGEIMKFAFAYSMGFAFGDLHDLVGEPSFRGFDLALLWPIYRSFYIGAALSTNHFYEEKDRATYERGATAVTGKLYGYVDYWNTALVTRYYLQRPESRVRAYGGVRLGLAAVRTTTFVADFTDQDDPLGFLVAPEVGMLIRIVDSVSASVAYQYNFSTASTSRLDNLSFGALQFGLSIQWPNY